MYGVKRRFLELFSLPSRDGQDPNHACLSQRGRGEPLAYGPGLDALAKRAGGLTYSCMAKVREIYVCSSCGAQSLQWLGQCPGCRAWNTLVPRTARPGAALSRPPARGTFTASEGRPVRLTEVRDGDEVPYTSGMEALDRVLGQGLVPGSAVLMGGEPGIGKSTLLLQVAGRVAASGRRVLYASGEEALSQLKARGERLGVLCDNLMAMSTSSVEEVIAALEEERPALFVLDSVQTMASAAAEGLPGNVSQVRAVAAALVEASRRLAVTGILVGHVTKDGALAGPRLLEHMVDTVLSIEGDRRQHFRLLRVLKNRFGPSDELLVLRMGGAGLEVVDDPSTFFLEDRDPSLSGTAVVMAVDGRRPLAVEVQALVARSFLTMPRRVALGFDANRLNLLLAVLEKRLRLSFAQVDIYAKVGGGMRLQEPGMDLALVAAVLSSFYDVPLPPRCVLFGEVDLNGQVRPVHAQEARLAQARRLGFDPIIHPGGPARTITELAGALFAGRCP